MTALKVAILLSDKRVWKAAAIILAAALTPFILLVVMLCSMLQGTASHNNAAVDLTFNGGSIPLTMPSEYKTYITEMRSCFSKLDDAIAEVESEMEDGDSLDSVRIKAVFYALYFGQDHLRLRDAAARSFVECFVTYETRTRTVTRDDEDGEDGDGGDNGEDGIGDRDDETEGEDEGIHRAIETYTVAVPISDLPTIYANVSNHIGREITSEDTVNITEIYLRVKYDSLDAGADMSLEGGNGTHDLIKEMTKDSDVEPSAGGFISPLADGWQDKVTSEFGYRSNPTGAGSEGHTGLDMGVPLGTEVRAVKDGRVLFVRYNQTGYGYHVAIDHGGGLVTMYAHCSEILVTEGQTVSAGDVIARSGSTGRSTGPHLHLEVIQDGTPQNPRNYL